MCNHDCTAEHHYFNVRLDTKLSTPALCMCRVMQYLGPGHQEDMCHEGCMSQHQYFYVRLRPDHSEMVKASSTNKRRLDLKVDLSRQHYVASAGQMLQLTQPQLQASEHLKQALV